MTFRVGGLSRTPLWGVVGSREGKGGPQGGCLPEVLWRGAWGWGGWGAEGLGCLGAGGFFLRNQVKVFTELLG